MKKKREMPKFAARRFNGKAEVVRTTMRDSVMLRATRDFRAWKKVFSRRKPVVIALTVPKGALFWTHGSTPKCRADRIISRGSGKSWRAAGGHTIYAPGKEMIPKLLFCKRDDVCASGIHFFPTEAAARNYHWS